MLCQAWLTPHPRYGADNVWCVVTATIAWSRSDRSHATSEELVPPGARLLIADGPAVHNRTYEPWDGGVKEQSDDTSTATCEQSVIPHGSGGAVARTPLAVLARSVLGVHLAAVLNNTAQTDHTSGRQVRRWQEQHGEF